MDRSEWAKRLEAEEKEARAAVDFDDVFGESVAPGAWFDLCRARALRGIRDALPHFEYEQDIEAAYATVDDRARAFQAADRSRRAKRWAVETRAILAAMVESGTEIGPEAFEAWERLPFDERALLLRLFGDNERAGAPCACDAPVLFRQWRRSMGDVKCSRCCTTWDVDDERGTGRARYLLPRDRGAAPPGVVGVALGDSKPRGDGTHEVDVLMFPFSMPSLHVPLPDLQEIDKAIVRQVVGDIDFEALIKIIGGRVDATEEERAAVRAEWDADS